MCEKLILMAVAHLEEVAQGAAVGRMREPLLAEIVFHLVALKKAVRAAALAHEVGRNGAKILHDALE